jgi:diguanylate cyclase (GGDEF)-like protein
MKSTKQIYLIFIFFSLILSVLIIWIEELMFENTYEKIKLENAVDLSKESENTIKSFLINSEQILLTLNNSSTFKKYLANSKDKEELENMFLAYIKANNDFCQIRYIDSNGFEKIRVQRDNENATPYPLLEDKLQNKHDKYYFKNSKIKELDKVWFSALDLNLENKHTAFPYQPTLRAILPIKQNDSFNGILIINYFMKSFLEKLTSFPLYDTILFDDNGYTLYHYSHRFEKNKKCWGNSLGHKYNILYEFPQYYQNILVTSVFKTDSFITRRFDLPIHDGINILLKPNESFSFNKKENFYFHSLVIAVTVFLISLILTFLVVKIFSRVIFSLDKVEKLNKTLNEASKIAKIGFWELEASSQNIEWSDGVYDIFEIDDKSASVNYDKFLNFIDKKDVKRLKHEFQSSINEKRDCFITHKITTQKNNVKFVEERAKHYFDNDGNLIKSVGSIYDITELHNAFEIIEKQSITDELTQIYNRKSYNKRISELLSEYKRYKTIFSFLTFDIDDFKAINDTYGHKSGDEVLVKLTKIVTSMIRKNDYFFRVGGEEFIILLSDTGIENARRFCEKLRRMVEEKVDILEDIKVTISIGVTEVKDGDTEDLIFKRADENLYFSKQHGKNRVSSIL